MRRRSRRLSSREACGDDEELRREVESLLAEEGAADRRMERPAAGTVSQRLAITRGARLGPYEVTELIGAGGMGEVYRATDTRLGREVAVKEPPADFASDKERLRRFEHEARAVASLNHPHILTVHDVGTHNGTPYVVTELLQGGTLRDVLLATRPQPEAGPLLRGAGGAGTRRCAPQGRRPPRRQAGEPLRHVRRDR